MILGLHQSARLIGILVVKLQSRARGDINIVGKSTVELYQPHQTIIDNSDEFRQNASSIIASFFISKERMRLALIYIWSVIDSGLIMR